MESVLLYFIDHFPDLMDINLTASIVILFVICVRQFLKGAPKIFSYALWGIVLLRLLVPVSIESPMSVVPERTEFSGMVDVNEVLPEIEFETAQDRVDNEWHRENTAPGEPMVQTTTSCDPQTYLTLAWLIGIAVMLVRSLLSYLRLRRQLKIVIPFRKGIYIFIIIIIQIRLLGQDCAYKVFLNPKDYSYIVGNSMLHGGCCTRFPV